MELQKQELMLLGKIDGKLDGIQAHMSRQDARLDQFERRVTERLDGMDTRLRDVEKKSAVIGAVSGSAVSVGVALLIEGIKGWMGSGGPTP